jgi:hypothetical protein
LYLIREKIYPVEQNLPWMLCIPLYLVLKAGVAVYCRR